MGQPCPSRCRAVARRVALALLSCVALVVAAKPVSAQSAAILVVGVSEVATGSPIADADVFLPELGRRCLWEGAQPILFTHQ